MTRKKLFKTLIHLTVSFALAFGCFAFGGAAEGNAVAALPNGDTALGSMRFQAPAEYATVRRDTTWNTDGAPVCRRL